MMHLMSILYDKSTTLLGDVNSEGSHTCIGARTTGEISESSSQFCFEPKTSLKK
jgi:hypothetical protein